MLKNQVKFSKDEPTIKFGRYLKCWPHTVVNRRRYIHVYVKTIVAPTLDRSNLNQTTLSVNEGEELQLFCDVSGRPQPTLAWYKDGRRINQSELEEDNIVEFSDDGRTLK